MERGELYWARLPGPAGQRPVVIVSRTRAAQVRSVVTVAPMTRTVRRIASELPLGPEDGLRDRCVASCDNLETVSKRRLDQPIGSLRPRKLAELDDALRFALGLRT